MAEILPCFHSFGSSPTASELLNSLASGLHRWLDSSFNNLGWTRSGPTDLHTLRLSSLFLIISSSIVNSSMLCLNFTGGIWGISPSGSIVKTLDNKFPRTSAFSLSESVSLDLGSYGSVFRSETPSRFLVLEFIYFHTAFGFVLDSVASFISNSFCILLVNLRTWFLALQYSV